MKNIIIITGASSGMGMEFAFQVDCLFLGSNIDEVWLLARREEQLREVANNMEIPTRVIPMDVNDKAEMKYLTTILRQEKPVIRMLINCAGYGMIGDFTSVGLEEQLGMIDTNCKALTHMTYLCLPYMKKESRIIQLASSAAFMPQPGFAVYAASKAYAYSFSKALSEELRKRKIYVTAVCPGPVDTPFFQIAEKYHKTFSVKKKFMADSYQVVRKALHDSHLKKRVSVYSLPMNAFFILAKCIPHDLILFFMRFLKGTSRA